MAPGAQPQLDCVGFTLIVDKWRPAAHAAAPAGAPAAARAVQQGTRRCSYVRQCCCSGWKPLLTRYAHPTPLAART